ncbi:MAG: carbohydrate ABC transporter permease [Anaerolineae bacterium]|jgi:multiple sugar transport system permease protein
MNTTTRTHGTGYRLRKAARLILDYLLMIGFAFFFLFPLVFMLVSSVKNEEMQVTGDMSTLYAFIPRGDLGFQNYLDVFEQLNFGRLMFNSVFIVTTMVLLGLAVNSLIAYALARLDFKGRGVVLSIIVSLIIVPFQAVAVPLLLMVNNLPWFDGSTTWLDSYHVQIIPFIADAFSIFLFYQFFIGLPKDLEEAALVDGASRLRIFWSIVLPLSRPVFATVAILQFLTHWGDFLWPLMVTRGEQVRPLTIGMQAFFGQDPRLWGDLMAFASMITVPVLIVFLMFQKWFVQSVATSGIKGGA